VKHLALVLANFRRKRIRMLLTVGSFAVALFLFGLLVTVHQAFYGGIKVAGADRLLVINRISLIQPLPLSYRERLQQVEGVKDVTFAWWFGGVYQDPRNFFPQFAVEHTTWRTVYPEFLVPDEQWQAFLADKQGCVVGEKTARRFGWKLGDRIPIKGTIFPGVWEFNLRAIYTGARPQDDTSQFWLRYDNLEEGAPEWFRGTVGWYVVTVVDPERAAAVVKAIDDGFANSPNETRTDVEKAWVASWVRQMGNIELLMVSVGTVVFFTLLLVTGNTMAIAVRERTAELAVLKTVGYADTTVMLLVLAESVLISLAGGLVGVGLAAGIGRGLNQALPAFGNFFLPGSAAAMGLGLAILVGVLAGLLPALSAMRLRVVDALRRV